MDKITLAQLTDLHLTGKVGEDDSYRRFLDCLELALQVRPDVLLLTGDLVNNGNKDGYDWLFKTLTKTALPFMCLAGNHDVTLEIGSELPYEERQFFAIAKDDRLIDCQAVSLGDYELICLNSTVAGCEFGRLSTHALEFLKHTLTQNHQRPIPKKTIIALHHHPVPVDSKWIDELMLQNSDEFFAVLTPFSCIQAILSGHAHQSHHLSHQGIDVFITPAVGRQFLPFSDTFALDTKPAGVRIFELGSRLTSRVLRL